MTKKQEIDDKEFAIKAARIARDMNCTDITVVDLRGKSPATDYFVIATGTSGLQARSVADEICVQAKAAGLVRFGQAGYEQGRWILVDFVNIVVHLFDAEYREYYNLEMLWGDAEKVAFD